MSKATEIKALERRIKAAKDRGNDKAAEEMTGVLLKLKLTQNKRRNSIKIA
jgi:hypothetical protein